MARTQHMVNPELNVGNRKGWWLFFSSLNLSRPNIFRPAIARWHSKKEYNSDYLVFSFKIATMKTIIELGKYEMRERREKASKAKWLKDESDRQ
jgi:hypothetical protein